MRTLSIVSALAMSLAVAGSASAADNLQLNHYRDVGGGKIDVQIKGPRLESRGVVNTLIVESHYHGKGVSSFRNPITGVTHIQMKDLHWKNGEKPYWTSSFYQQGHPLNEQMLQNYIDTRNAKAE